LDACLPKLVDLALNA
jgi:hypothetical protein